MTQTLLSIACGFAAAASGLVAGVFLAFSDFIMKSLATMPPTSGALAMQVINREVYGSIFLTLFMILAGLSLALGGYAAYWIEAASSPWLLAASGIYLLGVFFVTAAFNVPRNKRLDGLKRTSPEGVNYWARYQVSWTRLNHIRTVSSAAASVCFLIGATLF